MRSGISLPSVVSLRASLERALGDNIRDHRVLWHVIQFYLTGAAVQQTLKAKGIEYVPYLHATGLLERAWNQYRGVLDTVWRPYVDGKGSLDEAIGATVKMVVR